MIKELYYTPDISLATSLLSLGHGINGVERENDKCNFGYDENDRLKNDITDYWEGRIRIEPKKFMEAFRYIKNIINNRTSM